MILFQISKIQVRKCDYITNWATTFGEEKVQTNLRIVLASCLWFSVQWEDARPCLRHCTVTSPAARMGTTTVRHASTAATEGMSSGEYPAASASSAGTGTGSPPGVNVSRLEAARSQARLPPKKKRRTAASRLCVLAALQIKADVKSLGALLDQFYDKRRLLILSAPNMSDPEYQLQNIMIQVRRCAGSHLPLKTSTCSDPFPSSRSEGGLRVGPATHNADRAPGLAATGDGSHQRNSAGVWGHRGSQVDPASLMHQLVCWGWVP